MYHYSYINRYRIEVYIQEETNKFPTIYILRCCVLHLERQKALLYYLQAVITNDYL